MLTLGMWGLAFGQSGPSEDAPLNVQTYRPVMDADRTLWAESSGERLDELRLSARAFVHYVRMPFVYTGPGSAGQSALQKDLLQTNALAMASYDRFRVGLDLPVFLHQTGEWSDGRVGLGELAVDGRVTAIDRSVNPAGLAFGGRLVLPTATVDAPVAWGGPSGEVYAIIDATLDERWTLVGNAGARFMPGSGLDTAATGSQVFARGGVGYALSPAAGLSLDVNAQGHLGALDTVSGVPVEGLLGAWGRAGDLAFRGGVGTGLSSGVGAGDLRAVFAVGFEPTGPRDPDGDGIVGAADRCPDEPEDFDGFQDEDGCPDLDNDGDGIADVEDACPDEPEDFDGFQDEDGCPDPTHGVRFRVQQPGGEDVPSARVVVEVDGEDDRTGSGTFMTELHEGKYDVRANAPGFREASATVSVPLRTGLDEVTLVLQPEALLGGLHLTVQSRDGKPLPDLIWYVDGAVGPVPIDDGQAAVELPVGARALDIRHEGYISDRRTVELIEGETTLVLVELQPSRVELAAERIEIKDTVYFDTGKATIQARSFNLLDDVAGVLLDHPEILKVRIEGHTDSRGGADFNRRLSDDRAKAVRSYLVEKGVQATRLDAIGYGEDRPVDSRENEAGWARNRRVDFFIVERAAE